MIKEILKEKQQNLKRIINNKFRPDERLEVWIQIQNLKKDGNIRCEEN